MFKLLLLVIGAWLIFLILRRQRRHDAAAPPFSRTQMMVRCEECGMFIPKSESVIASGRYYCCDAHATRHTSA